MKRTIVVTGAASGIGRATAEILEQQGDTVIRVDLEKGDVTGDLGDRDAIVQVAQKIADLSGGRIDGLVANAGVSAPTPLSPKINYIGTVLLIEALRPLLAESDAPRISVTTSAATLQGNDEKLVDLLLSGDAEAALARGAELASQGPQLVMRTIRVRSGRSRDGSAGSPPPTTTPGRASASTGSAPGRCAPR